MAWSGRLASGYSLRCERENLGDEMLKNHVKRAIREGQPTIGTWLSLSSVLAAERMALAGVDWLTIDIEHAPTNWETAAAMAATQAVREIKGPA